MELSERPAGVSDQRLTVVDFDDVQRRARSIAIGTFDGVHLGHRDVIRGCDTVLTFAPHPLQILRPDSVPALLTTQRQKIEKLAALGIREIVIIPFDASWARQPAENFVDDVLVNTLNANHVSIGFNFRYGAQGTGTPLQLQQDVRFRTRVVPAITVESTVVSSTAIRAFIERGDLARAERLLGAPVALPVTIRDDHAIDFAPGFAIPSIGTYVCDIGGITSRVSFNGPPRICDPADTVESYGPAATITFLYPAWISLPAGAKPLVTARTGQLQLDQGVDHTAPRLHRPLERPGTAIPRTAIADEISPRSG